LLSYGLLANTFTPTPPLQAAFTPLMHADLTEWSRHSLDLYK